MEGSCLALPGDGRRAHPVREAGTAQDAEAGAATDLTRKNGGAQLFVGGDGVALRETYLIRFFLRTNARSRLRRWTSMPKRALIASRRCAAVISGLSALSLARKATTSSESL